MLLRWLAERRDHAALLNASGAIEEALVGAVSRPETRTKDLGGELGTAAFTGGWLRAFSSSSVGSARARKDSKGIGRHGYGESTAWRMLRRGLLTSVRENGRRPVPSAAVQGRITEQQKLNSQHSAELQELVKSRSPLFSAKLRIRHPHPVLPV